MCELFQHASLGMQGWRLGSLREGEVAQVAASIPLGVSPCRTNFLKVVPIVSAMGDDGAGKPVLLNGHSDEFVHGASLDCTVALFDHSRNCRAKSS
jgi:hypothetical protein